MLQIIYVSTETRPMTSKGLADLLRTSRANNAERNVTGLLLYEAGDFLQVLEGEADAVEALMETIAADERHHDVTVLSRETINEREFGDWSMAFENIDALSEEERDGHSDFLNTPLTADDFADDPGLARRFLTHFKSKTRQGMEPEEGARAA